MNNPNLSVFSAQQLLENNILPFWSTRMVDHQHGGFYGRIDGKNTLHPEAKKGAVLNARILWTFSAASRVLHRMPYRILAARAKDYLSCRFIDHEYGGVFWSLNADGTPLDTKKQTYAIAFAIYGLSEYYRITEDRSAIDAAIGLFEDLEAHAYSSTGYVEALTRDWQPIADMRLSESDENGSRTMNTHLHVLEAYTNLYRVWPDERVKQRIIELLDIFATRIYNPENGHLGLFFDDDWSPITHQTSNIKHHTSFSPGHDIEAAWLLREAVHVLNHKLEIINPKFEIIHSLSRSLAQAAEDDILNETQWWCYAEAVVGYLDQSQASDTSPQETTINREMAQAAFDYINSHLIDPLYGEWYWGVQQDGSPDTENDKAGFWKCPYHNSRMCIEIIERLKL